PQFEDWKNSLHSHAMGPGIMGQLVEMAPEAFAEHQGCIRCHAPLKEQALTLSSALKGEKVDIAKTHAWQNSQRPLHTHGLVCSACHLRGYEVHGPPRQDGTVPSENDGAIPHNGWQSSSAFEDSRFCAACHQFQPDEYALNGKLLENTYEEWKASRYAREGQTCQSCHMPERRHLWRGIHDPETTKNGVDIRLATPNQQGDMVVAQLTIANTGTGHYFPTYVTPKIVVEGYQEDAAGNILADTLYQTIIGRQVSLDLSEEIADTRIAPDEVVSIDYRMPKHTKAATLVFQVRVEPDAFYTEFYRALLEGGFTDKGEALIRQALTDSLASIYTLYSIRKSLPLY
ncbi:MAG: hypothetical protein GY731_11680, partial [Gammaproteobacteria bacterium]|nr:hypothetical protein [Gammaproteobacteria bacterium]